MCNPSVSKESGVTFFSEILFTNKSTSYLEDKLSSEANYNPPQAMEDYKKAMEGIYTTSINEDTLDEAPMAYKSLNDIIDVIGETVEVIEVIKPIYNFKASEPVKFGKNMR